MVDEQKALNDILGEKGTNEVLTALKKHIKGLEDNIPLAKEFGDPLIVEFYERRLRVAKETLLKFIRP